MDFRVLGPLEVIAEGEPLRVGMGRQRSLLAVLLVRANRVVGNDELVEVIWGRDVPANPRAAVETCVTRLRNTLGNGAPVIETSGDGYVLGSVSPI